MDLKERISKLQSELKGDKLTSGEYIREMLLMFEELNKRVDRLESSEKTEVSTTRTDHSYNGDWGQNTGGGGAAGGAGAGFFRAVVDPGEGCFSSYEEVPQ